MFLFFLVIMQHLSWPYGTLVEFDQYAARYGLEKWLADYYQSKWWSFYCVLHPEWRRFLRQIAAEYIDAGVEVLITPTYRWGNHFLRDDDDALLCTHWTEIIAKDICALWREHGCTMWWSIWPIGDSYTAVGSPHTVWLAYEKHKAHVHALASAGVDALLFETAIKYEEIQGVIKCAEEVKLPLVLSFYVNEHGQIPEPSGACSLDAMIEKVTSFAQTCGVQIVYGINCAPKQSILTALQTNTLAKQYIQVLYPNASHPTATSYTTCEHDGSNLDDFFACVKELWYTITYGGWCCGYTPQDISAMQKV